MIMNNDERREFDSHMSDGDWQMRKADEWLGYEHFGAARSHCLNAKISYENAYKIACKANDYAQQTAYKAMRDADSKYREVEQAEDKYCANQRQFYFD